MNAEFNWWLLIVGIVAGAGLAWLVLADSTRREREVGERELPAEAEWVSRTLEDGGTRVTAAQAEAVLRAHRTYLGFPPPDALVDPDELQPDAAVAVRASNGTGEGQEPPARPNAPAADRPVATAVDRPVAPPPPAPEG